jgi:hypothetical protein
MVSVPLWRSKPTPRAILRTLDPRLASTGVVLRDVVLDKDRARYVGCSGPGPLWVR